MATSALPSAQRSGGESTVITQVMVKELRSILDRCDAGEAQTLVAEFVARNRLTHRDVDVLVVSLAQEDVTNVPIRQETLTAAGSPPVEEHTGTVPVPAETMMTSAESYRTADEPVTEASDNEFAWMFEEEPEPPAPRPVDDVVGQTFDDLMGDWSRTGGQLTQAKVALLATKRQLTSGQHGELLRLLEEAGVDLPVSTDFRPRRTGPTDYKSQGDSLGQYLHTMGRYPLISASREVELWSLISQGRVAQEELDTVGEDRLTSSIRLSLQTRAVAGRRAHAELVCANLRLVVSIAKARYYESSGVELADRIQDGNLGLMHAADKFDGSKGFKFSTYATWWIKQAITRGIADRGRTIRIPVHLHEKLQKVRRAVAKLTARLDREPTLAEISDFTGIEPGKVQAALDLMRPLRSLDELFGDEGDLHLSDVLVRDEERDGRTDPAEIVIHAMLHRDVRRMLRTLLPERAACVVERRFGIGTGDTETLEDIAADYGITRERIRQIQNKSLTTLRESGNCAALRSYLIDDLKNGWSYGSAEGKAS